ncbi:MAG: hypothetical protein AB1425_14535 [Actinomycetota bacterium]
MMVDFGCLISPTTCCLRTSFALFAEPISEGRAGVFAEPFRQGRVQQLWAATICDERERQLAHGQVRPQNVGRDQFRAS